MSAPRLTADALDLEVAQLQTLVEHARLQGGDIPRDGLLRSDIMTLDAVLAILWVVSERLGDLSDQLAANMPALRKALPEEQPAAEAEA